MRVFNSFAENTIQTSTDGRRILAVYGPFARPFEMSGPDTEERIVQKLACAYRLSVISLLALVLLLCRWPNKHILFARLPATAVLLEMPFGFFHFLASDDLQSKTSPSETQDRDNPVAGKPEFSGSGSGLWDREIDSNT
jgi:hypothetical protein